MKKPIHVHRIVAASSIEENILVLQRVKDLAIAEAFAKKSTEELRKERLEIVYNLFGEPQKPAGAESVDDRIMEMRASIQSGEAGAVTKDVVADDDGNDTDRYRINIISSSDQLCFCCCSSCKAH